MNFESLKQKAQAIWGYSRFAILLFIAAFVVLTAAAQIDLPYRLEVGTPLDFTNLYAFHAIETGPQGQPFRWSRAVSLINLLAPHGNTPRLLRLRLAGKPPGQSSTNAYLMLNNQVKMPFNVPAGGVWQTYEFVLDDPRLLQADELTIALHADTFVPGAGDTRELGVVMAWAELSNIPAASRGMVMPDLGIVALALAISLGSLVLRRWGTPERLALVCALATLILVSMGVVYYRLDRLSFALPLLILLIVGYRAAILSAPKWGYGLTILGIGVWAIFFLSRGPQLWPDSCWYAQEARDVLAGRGLSAFTLEPLRVLIIVPFMQLFGVSDWAAALTSGFCFILTIPLAYALAYKLGGNQVAILATLLVVFNNQLLSFSTTGLTEVSYAFFITLLLYSILSARQGRGFLLSGIIFGLTVALRRNSLPFLPLLLGYILFTKTYTSGSTGAPSKAKGSLHSLVVGHQKQWLYVGYFVIGFLLIFFPLRVGNYQEFMGNVGGLLLHYTPAELEMELTPSTAITPIPYLLSQPWVMWDKILFQASKVLGDLWTGYGIGNADAFLISIFLVSILATIGRSGPHKGFKILVYSMILTQLVVGLFLALRWRHFYGFAPIALILIAEFIVMSVHGQPGSAKEMPARRSWVEWLLYTALLIFIIALGPPLIGGDAERSRFQQELLSRFLAAETQIR